MSDFSIAELARRLSNIIRVGTVQSVNTAGYRATVTIGPLLTAPLPWLTTRAGADRTWWAPTVGEQVLVLSPDGELATGWILPGAYTDTNEAPADVGTVHRTVYSDGTVVEYDRAGHNLKADVKGSVELLTEGNVTAEIGGNLSADVTGTVDVVAGGAASITAPSVTVDSPTSTFTGNVAVQGSLSYGAGMTGTGGANIAGSVGVTGGDVTADGISLKTHLHTGVVAGPANTGGPI